MAGNKEWNADLELRGKAMIYTVPNGTGTVLTYNSTTKEVSTRTNTQFIGDLGLATQNDLNNYWKIHYDASYKGINTDKPFAVINGGNVQTILAGGLTISSQFSDEQYQPAWGIHAKGFIQTDEGFLNRYWKADVRNSIWAFANSQKNGISYYQGAAHIWGEGFGFHFENVNTPNFFINQYGGINASNTIQVGNQNTTGSGNAGNSGTNYQMILGIDAVNSGKVTYGTAFWTEGSGQGFIQQQRFDNQDVPYNLNLQPYGGNVIIRKDKPNVHEEVLVTYGKISSYGNENNSVKTYINSDGTNRIIAGHTYNWYDTSWKAGNIRGGSSDSLGYGFYFSSDDGTNYSEKLRINTDGNLITQSFGSADLWNQAYQWGNHSNSGYATQSWVNTNFIPKTHPVYNVTQANIDGWNSTINLAHSHLNILYLNNIDQALGTGQEPQFGSVRLMNNLGYGTLALEENSIGGELGLVDLDAEKFYVGRYIDYLKLGSSIQGYQGLNYHLGTNVFGVGKEITNDEDKLQVAGNISVDTIDINDISTELILNPLYTEEPDISWSRHAHNYLVVKNTVILPDIPIKGQRFEIYNQGNIQIAVMHNGTGTLFYIKAFYKVIGFVGLGGYIFDSLQITQSEYSV